MNPSIGAPSAIRYHRQSRVLEVEFRDGTCFNLSAEYLRVHSPSAEVRGHGRGQEVLQVGKEAVRIERIEPIGNYAVRLVFDDGHDSGLYSWEELHALGTHEERNWAEYLERLEQAGHRRRPQLSVIGTSGRDS